MNELSVLQKALSWCEAGHRTVLATVVRTWGSAPRRVGSHMAIRSDGQFEGSVSGGCVEGATIQAAQDALNQERAQLISFGVSTETAWTVGLACGGDIEIFLTPIQQAELHQLIEAIQKRQPIQITWSTPVPASVVEPISEAHSALCTHEPQRICRRYLPRLRLVIVGASHIAQALAPMATLLDYDVHVLDPRAAFVSPSRWPHSQTHCLYPDEWMSEQPIDAHTAVVALSHDPKIDDPGLECALRSPAFYIGALGSTRSHAARLERLRLAGHSPETLQRIHGPVGLDIGAATPAEIATAIMAECTQILRKGQKR